MTPFERVFSKLVVFGFLVALGYDVYTDYSSAGPRVGVAVTTASMALLFGGLSRSASRDDLYRSNCADLTMDYIILAVLWAVNAIL